MSLQAARLKPALLIGLAGITFLYAALCAGLYWAMSQPPEVFGGIMARTPGPAMMLLPFRPLWMHARRGPVAPGDTAPDFTLPRLDGSGKVRLSEFRGSRPVVLVFGSYT